MALFDGNERIQAPPDMVWQAVYEFAREGKIEIEQPHTFLMAAQMGFAFAYLLGPLPDGTTQLWHVIDRVEEFYQSWHDNPDPQMVLNALVEAPTSAALLQGEARLKTIRHNAEESAQQVGGMAAPLSRESAAPECELTSVTPLTTAGMLEPALSTSSSKGRVRWKHIWPALIVVIVLTIFELAEFSPALTAGPAATHFTRGVELGKKKEWNAAVEEYTQAIQLDNKMAEAYLNRGYAYFQRSKLDAALADFDTVVTLDPTMSMAYRSRGLVYAVQGEAAKATADAHQAVKLDPKDAKAFWLCGQLHFDQNEKTEAKADLEQSVALGLDPEMKLTAEEALQQIKE